MQVGVDNFSGERLAQAMAYRMVSKGVLAEQLSVNASTITKYLNGDARPKPDNFVKIYQILGFPPPFFTSEAVVVTGQNLWRSFASAKALARQRGEVVLDWQVEIWKYFNSIFNLPKFDLSAFQVQSSDYNSITYDQIDQIALQIREHWGIGSQPIGNLVRLMERSGVVLNQVNLMVEKLDAVSSIREEVPFVLLNSFDQASARSRFNAAHELGHLILHSKVGKSGILKEGFDTLEDQAHYFASSLLLPAEAFLRDLWAPTMNCFIELKEKWGASLQAEIRRALELNAITQAQYNYLNINISKRRWRKFEPLDESMKVEAPRLFAKCLEKMERERGVSPRELLEQLRLPVDVVEQVFALESGYFEGNSDPGDSNIISFKSATNSDLN